jgi:acetyl-CoA C-acetyltransferase
LNVKRPKKNRNVGIIGVGQTVYSSHKEHQNQPEMIYEAVREALNDAKLSMDDIDCVVHGNMELFEMQFQPDLWHTLGTGSYGKQAYRITTGGTTGSTLVCAGDNLVASGRYNIVMVIGMEKLQEGHTTAGITNMACPLWHRHLQTGALGSNPSARALIREFGAARARKAAITYRILMDKHAMLNPKAHRKFGFEYDQAENLMKSAPRLVGELTLIHMCSQSDGACVLILAAEDIARATAKNPAWIRDHVTVHREEAYNIFGHKRPELTHKNAARKLFERNGIKNPVDYFDVFEMYDPSAWWALEWLRDFLMLKGDEHLKLLEKGDFAIGGRLPINPSGGVISSNPIGATAAARIAEGALQIRGKAGAHQVKGVEHVLCSGFGGTRWTNLMILEKNLNWTEV